MKVVIQRRLHKFQIERFISRALRNIYLHENTVPKTAAKNREQKRFHRSKLWSELWRLPHWLLMQDGAYSLLTIRVPSEMKVKVSCECGEGEV